MAACCGEERTTAFCPDCGAALCHPVKAGLIGHLRWNVRKAKTKADQGERKLEGEPGNGIWETMLSHYRSEQARWQSWLDWVLKQGE